MENQITQEEINARGIEETLKLKEYTWGLFSNLNSEVKLFQNEKNGLDISYDTFITFFYSTHSNAQVPPLLVWSIGLNTVKDSFVIKEHTQFLDFVISDLGIGWMEREKQVHYSSKEIADFYLEKFKKLIGL